MNEVQVKLLVAMIFGVICVASCIMLFVILSLIATL